jgi:AraC-like DNA-binding protein
MFLQDSGTILQTLRAGVRGAAAMNGTNGGLAARAAAWRQAGQDELVARLARAIRAEGTVEPMEGVRLHRAVAATEQGHGVSYPSFCVIAQGSKDVLLGNHRYRYNPADYLIASAALPIATRVIEASPERPYLGVVVKLDPALVSAVLAETGHLALRGRHDAPAIAVSPLDGGMLEAILRLVRLLDAPADAPFLAPLAKRELIYRLLRGEQGDRLHQIAALGGEGDPIAAAIERLRLDFDQPLRIEEIARELGMSVSGFHHQFKAITAMSPLQFQKQLRLQEARRLMLGEGLDVAGAGHRVGYGDASHFTRDYKRLFGAPPLRDVERLRGAAKESAGL